MIFVMSHDTVDTCPPSGCGFGFLFFGLIVAFWVDFVFAEDGALVVEDGDFFVFDEGDDVEFVVGSADA